MFELCKEKDLEDDVPLECEAANGDLVVVIRHGGKYYAVAGECPHQAAPMADAEVANGEITCCLHFWSWKLENGEPLEDAEEPLPTYPIKVADGVVYME